MRLTVMLLLPVLAFMSGCSDEPATPRWVEGARSDLQADVRDVYDGAARAYPLDVDGRWFIMLKGGDGRFAGLGYLVKEDDGPRGFTAQALSGKASQVAEKFSRSPVLAGYADGIELNAIRERFVAAYQ